MFDLLRRKSALHAAAWAASALLLASCGGSTEENPAPPPIANVAFVLGASLSDNGNTCTANPAGCPPAPPYSPGIYSNGPLWVDTVVARLGASATPSLKGGTNYAFAGARTGAVPGAGSVPGTAASVPSMLEQFNTLLLKQNNRIDPSALVIVDAVTFFNNINVALVLSAASPANATTIATNVVTGGVTDIVTILNLIYNTGGRNVLVLNMVNAGKVPAVVAGRSGRGRRCLADGGRFQWGASATDNRLECVARLFDQGCRHRRALQRGAGQPRSLWVH